MLTITIPMPAGEVGFLDIEVNYDIIATAGPPKPPLDTFLTGWTFIECWRPLDDGDMEAMCLEGDPGGLPPRYVQYIDKYVGDNFLDIQKTCRDFELTQTDNVV